MSQPTSFTNKLTDALIKLIWAGSGGYALYSLYTDELPKAAISGLVSAGAALMTSFGQGLMEQLTSSMKLRGESTGKFVDKTLDTTVDIAWARLSRFHKQYLEALKTQCYAVEIEGFQDLPALALEEVFVPLRIEADHSRLGLATGPQEIWDFLPQRYQTPQQFPHRRMVILAAPGYGKTTLMRHLTLIFVSRPPTDKPEFMPILLRFREVYSLMSAAIEMEVSNSLNLPELVALYLTQQPEFEGLQPSPNWFTEQLKQGCCLVMLDGLDEVPKRQRQSVRQWVDQQMKIYDKTQFILTSRPHGFELQPDEPSYPIQVDLKLKVLDFNPDQKQDFVEKWYRTVFWRMKWEKLLVGSQRNPEGATLTEEQAKLRSEQEAQEAASELVRQIVNSPALNDLARNPLLVTMIASTHRTQTVLPKRRVELYDKIFDLLLGTRPYAKKTALTLTATETRVVLQELAWQLVNAEKTQFSLRQSKFWIVEVLNRCLKDRAFLPEQFIDEMVEIAGVLVEKERDAFEFSHQTFQEYLAALHVRELGDIGEALLLEKLANDRWREVIRFYAALGNATPIIDALLEQPSEYTLPLAKKCMDEGREIEPETLERLQAALAATPLAFGDLAAEVLLEKRFRQLLKIGPDTAITTGLISWSEYSLFLEAQWEKLFHSTATTRGSLADVTGEVTDISWEDARWFCAWLSTRSSLQEEGRVFNYRLPEATELEQVPAGALQGRQPWTIDPQVLGNALLVVREELPERYGALVNYLANGRWREADEETYEVMTQVAGGDLTAQRLQEFPREDLRIIDQLWVKFSGGRFGFSVQKLIYVEAGNPLDGEYHKETWKQFCDRNGWLVNGNYFDNLIFSTDAPNGHLPVIWGGLWVRGRLRVSRIACGSLLSRPDL